MEARRPAGSTALAPSEEEPPDVVRHVVEEAAKARVVVAVTAVAGRLRLVCDGARAGECGRPQAYRRSGRCGRNERTGRGKLLHAVPFWTSLWCGTLRPPGMGPVKPRTLRTNHPV